MPAVRGGPARVAREHPALVTGVLAVLGYALVIGTLYIGLPIYPDIGRATVNRLSHAIAALNTITVVVLSLGWYWIRRGQVRRHRVAMLTAFALILLFLVLYLTKTGGGGRKDVVGAGTLQTAYLAMLAIHIILSVLSVPLVLYQVVTGLAYTPAEIRRTSHPRVGRVAVAAWIVSLILGVLAYLLLNYTLEYEFVEMLLLPGHLRA